MKTSTARVLAVLFAALLVSCGPMVRVALVGTPEVDSVIGKLELEKAEGDLVLLTAVLKELPSPEKVHPDATRFLAWITGPSGEPRILGVVERDPVKREGRIGATIADRTFLFQVTAEGEETPDEPSPHVVVRRQVTAENE
ncbi:MAG: hypothetical protein GXY23_06840 [Myxococcales bacterium]|mgnify:CR=1 FL=1|nr:hypothetical protein [Myxococcales bacterium]